MLGKLFKVTNKPINFTTLDIRFFSFTVWLNSLQFYALSDKLHTKNGKIYRQTEVNVNNSLLDAQN